MQVLIVDDHPLYRDALRSTIGLALPASEVIEADTIEAALITLARSFPTDLILLDLSMQGVSGFDGLMSIRRHHPKVPILVVSGRDEPRMAEDALRFGAAGFVSKSAERKRLIQAMEDVVAGRLSFPGASADEDRAPSLAARIAKLTPQQFRVLLMIRQGKLNKQIAHELTVGDSTIKAHVTEILRKLGVASRTQIVIETAALNFDRP